MENRSEGQPVAKGFRYASDTNPNRLTQDRLQHLISTVA